MKDEDQPRYQLCKGCGAKDCDCTIDQYVSKDLSCRTCKHWEPPPGLAQKGACLLFIDEGEAPPSRAPRAEHQLAAVEGMYGHGATLVTAGEFFCVAHEEKK